MHYSVLQNHVQGIALEGIHFYLYSSKLAQAIVLPNNFYRNCFGYQQNTRAPPGATKSESKSCLEEKTIKKMDYLPDYSSGYTDYIREITSVFPAANA